MSNKGPLFSLLILALIGFYGWAMFSLGRRYEREDHPRVIIVYDRDTNHLMFYDGERGWRNVVDGALEGKIPESAISTGRVYPSVSVGGSYPTGGTIKAEPGPDGGVQFKEDKK